MLLSRELNKALFFLVASGSVPTGLLLAQAPAPFTPVVADANRYLPTFHSAGLIRSLEITADTSNASVPISPPVVEEAKLVVEQPKPQPAITTEIQVGTVAPSEGSKEVTPIVEPVDIEINKPLIDPVKGPIALTALLTPNTSIDGIGTGIRPEDVTIGRMPEPRWLPTGLTREGEWLLESKQWVPGGFCHQPLYFEEPMLERHGHERFPCYQPIISGIRFFGTFPVYPYLATLRHPLDEVHTLGAYRPGSPAPMLRYRAHYDESALRNEVITGAAATVLVAP